MREDAQIAAYTPCLQQTTPIIICSCKLKRITQHTHMHNPLSKFMFIMIVLSRRVWFYVKYIICISHTLGIRK